MDKITERDIPADRETQERKLVRFLDKTGAKERIGIPQNRKDFLLNLNTSQLEEWLTRINGISRNIAPKDRKVDGESVEVPSLMPPEPEDKKELLDKTLVAAKSILFNVKDPQEALDTVSLLFSGSINYIHPFADGNGRTSRIVGYLIKDGYDGSPQAQKNLAAIMGENGRNVFCNNPDSLTNFLTGATVREFKSDAYSQPFRLLVDTMAGEPLGDEAVGTFDPDTQEKLQKTMRDPHFSPYATAKIMFERGKIPEGVETNAGFAWVAPENYFSKCNEEDINAIIDTSRQMRKERVLKFIEAMKNPDKFPIRLTERSDDVRFEDRDTTIKDFYEEHQREYSSLYSPKNPVVRKFENQLISK